MTAGATKSSEIDGVFVRVTDVTTRRAAIPPLLKQLNERTVLETIRSAAPISRAEISRQAGISKPTVSLALQSLLESGLVRETEPEVGTPRYGAVFFEAVPDAALVLGLDIGARFLRGAICDLSGAVRARQDVELPDVEVGRALDTITKLRTSLVDASDLPAHLIDSAVVGVPAVVDDETGRLSMATNVPGLEGSDFRTDLVERLDLPVTLDNDINLAARGEQWRGVARGIEDFVFLSVGTGLGAGLVLRGELHRGRNGAAGEVDLVASGRLDEIDPCAAAVAELTGRLASEGVETRLVPPYDARSVFGSARAGDPLGRAVVAEEAKRIALHIAPIAAVTDVALVVLGGGIGANGDLLLDPIRDLLAGWLPFPPRIEVSGLGDAAVLTGALAVGLELAQESVFANRHDGRTQPSPQRA
jgi:predicted NBD/HSP70 family sugar kinase